MQEPLVEFVEIAEYVHRCLLFQRVVLEEDL